MLRSPAEIEDAAQEALLRVWRSAPTPQELERPVAWLRRIARNEALRVYAREGRRDEVALQDMLDSLAAPAGRGGALAEHRELVDLVAALSPADRKLVWLRYIEDLTQENVARRLGIPEGTVKVRLHRARNRLRRVVEQP